MTNEERFAHMKLKGWAHRFVGEHPDRYVELLKHGLPRFRIKMEAPPSRGFLERLLYTAEREMDRLDAEAPS
jgi:hypothetical protein